MEHLEGCFELSLLSKMTRDERVGILTVAGKSYCMN